METIRSRQHIFRFGPFEVDLLRGELHKRGIKLGLQDQPLKVLTALLERPGEIVGRDELRRRLWPEETFVDFDHSLNAAVRRLRVVLGDTAETPRFIETVHRRGYRFLTWGLVVNEPASRSVTRRARARMAVLPFASFYEGETNDGFSEGLTEEIITQLARICAPRVGVIARTSVMRLSRPDQAAAKAGPLLDADYIVEGSIRREHGRIRITAELIDVHEEIHVWAASYDRAQTQSGEPLSLQSEVAEQIAGAVARALNALQPPLSREAS